MASVEGKKRARHFFLSIKVAPAEPFFSDFFSRRFFQLTFFPFGPMPNPGNGKFRYEREKSTFFGIRQVSDFFHEPSKIDPAKDKGS
jgi:hypothetical protein